MELVPTFRALDQRRAFEQIILQIEEAIIAGSLRPGDRLPPERQLAETFGVSRASVREALRVLERFGVLSARVGQGPSSGSVIAESASMGLISALRLHAAVLRIPTKDIVDVRTVLEMQAVRLASKSPAEHYIAQLRELVDLMEAAQAPDEFHRHDTEFHVTLALASGNELLPVLMESLRGAMQRDMLAGYARQGNWARLRAGLLSEHRRILSQVEAGDGERAAETAKRHIEEFYRQALAPEEKLRPEKD